MNLHDVVPLQKVKTTKRPAGLADLVASQKPLIDAIETISRSLSHDRATNEVIDRLRIEVADKSNKFLLDYFKKNDALPDVELVTVSHSSYDGAKLVNRSAVQILGSNVGRLAESPRAKLSDLRSLSDALALTIIPVDYLSKKSYEGSYNVENQVNLFRKAAHEQEMDVYVMAPVRHYDVLRQIKSQDPGGQMYSLHHNTAFESLQMTMPALVMMSDAIVNIGSDLQSIFKRLDSLESTVKSTVRGLELMDKRMTELSKRVDEQQEQRLLEQIQIKKLEEDLIRARAESSRAFDWFAVGDPMVFALPKGTSLATGEALAIVGPCWGPEFDEVIVKALDIMTIPNQRESLKNTLYRLW